MSDWSTYELEDIVWDKCCSDDHMVPHPDGEQVNEYLAQGDCHKKPRHVGSDAGRCTYSKKPVPENVFQGKGDTAFHSTLKDQKNCIAEKGSWSHAPDTVFHPSCSDTDCINKVTSFASEDTKLSDNFFQSTNVDSVGNEFCTDNPILGNRRDAIDRNFCRFPLGDISPAESDLDFFGNEQEDKGSDLLEYGWPDIGNFEDVDRMFRNCDSTFGQGNSSTVDELSWFSSSSHVIDSAEDAFKSAFGSSCSELSASKSTSKHNEAQMNCMPGHESLVTDSEKKNDPNFFKVSSWTSDADQLASLGYSTYANQLDVDAKNKGETEEKEDARSGGNDVKISTPSQDSNGRSVMGCQGADMVNVQRKQSKSQKQSELKRKDRSSECLTVGSLRVPGPVQQFSEELSSSVPSTQKVFPSEVLSQKKQLWGPNSFSYLHTYIPNAHLSCNNPSHQIPVTPMLNIKSEEKSHPSLSYDVPHHSSHDPLSKSPALMPEENIEKLCRRHQIQATLTTEHRYEHLVCQAPYGDQAPVQKQLHEIQDEVGGESEVENLSTEMPAVEIDSSTVQASSCMFSKLSDEISLGATSFQQLQDVMEQLDVRTKLCIRDSLYRLAKSAEQRHTVGNTIIDNRGSRDKSGFLTTESNKFAGFTNVETDTNSIDRSIAYLLFHQPSEPSTRPANDALSLESHMIIHGSIASHPGMHDQLVCDEDIAGGTGTK